MFSKFLYLQIRRILIFGHPNFKTEGLLRLQNHSKRLPLWTPSHSYIIMVFTSTFFLLGYTKKAYADTPHLSETCSVLSELFSEAHNNLINKYLSNALCEAYNFNYSNLNFLNYGSNLRTNSSIRFQLRTAWMGFMPRSTHGHFSEHSSFFVIGNQLWR